MQKSQYFLTAFFLLIASIGLAPSASAHKAERKTPQPYQEKDLQQVQPLVVRHLHFPPAQSVGELFYCTTWDLTQNHTEGKYIGQARGDYQIASKLPIILNINYNGADKPALLDQVSNNIDWLNLGKYQVDDSTFPHITHLTNLKRLDLYNTDVTDIGIAQLAKLTNLETLNASSTSIKGKTIFQLPLKKLTFLAVDCNILDLKTLAKIINYPHLKRLEIQRTNIGDRELVFIGKLRELKELNLCGDARISDTGLQNLKNLQKLERLDLRDTAVTIKGLLSIKFPLCGLSLPGSAYSAAEMAALHKHFPRCYTFTRPAPTKFQKELFAPLH